MTSTNKLILGWRVDSEGHPRYWLSEAVKPCFQEEGDLVTVPANIMDSHAVIIAQSGSGKSFFLGRLIEELLLQTRARCLILDPNAVFRKVHTVEGEQLWANAKYDSLKRRGKLPHENSRAVFTSQWKDVRIRIRALIYQ